MERYCRVAVDSPVLALDRPFDYAIPERMLGQVAPGSVVRVRMHGRRMRAYVTELLEEPAVPDPAALSELVGDVPLYDQPTLSLARWAADRYLSTWGAVLHHAVPGRYSAPTRAAPEMPPRRPIPPPAWLPGPDAVARPVADARHAVLVLPHASSQVEAIAHAVGCVPAGGGVLVIAPRIAEAERIGAALEGAAVLHSDQRPAARAAAWARARDGSGGVLVGGRAAAFAPVRDLALVIVASAHDSTLKEERTPRFHALPLLRRRARDVGAAFLAVSPAPPLDLAAEDVGWIHPRHGVGPRVRPEIVSPRGGPVTPRLLDAIHATIADGRDALVFTGRRGHALRTRCADCGWYPRCPRCDLGLTAFTSSGGRHLRCRGCGAVAPPPTRCGSCDGASLSGRGWGDERLAEALAGYDLGAPILRVDADAPLPADRPSPAVVVGTSAAAWALEGADVGLVAVADLDQLLGLPDFRAGEFALGTLHDLAGVLSPGGRMLVGTREADHRVVQAFARRSHRFFMDRELPGRRAVGYPPAGDVVQVELASRDVDDLRSGLADHPATILGPLPRPGGRSAVLLRTPDVEALLAPLREFLSGHERVHVDVDPVDVL